MHDQLSLPIDRKLQNSLILSMKSSIGERIHQSALVILQLLYKHFHQDHKRSQHRRSNTILIEHSPPTLQPVPKPVEQNNENNNNNVLKKVSALVAHYSSGEISSTNVRDRFLSVTSEMNVYCLV